MTPSQFELEVIGLLRLQRWKVTPECIVGHKKVDCFATKLGNFGQTERIAVECKYYTNKLTKSQLITIVADYLPLVNSQIDYLLLVTANGLSPSAETYVKNSSHLRHITYSSLLNSVQSFHQYVTDRVAECERLAPPFPYIPQYCNEVKDKSLEDCLYDWVTTNSSQPIAVLGGYGMGKSTLARQLTVRLGREFISDPTNRIPILIRLEEIAGEQTLEGLLGRHFTALYEVDNFRFSAFMDLNSRGRFVVILDGFDEMKRSISWESLRYNFTQINRLVCEKSKVLLLGRANTFITEEEQEEILHGVRRVRQSGADQRIDGSPDYIEYNLNLLTRPQVHEVLSYAYSNALGRDITSQPSPHSPGDELRKMEAIPSHVIDIASRPVQLKMLIDVLPHCNKSIDDLTVTSLYSLFIDRVMHRELEKSSRLAISIERRRQFSASLAYWMWTNRMGSKCDGRKMPDWLFSDSHAESVDIDALKRDMLTGTILERRSPDGFTFPHRSFQEFLVAEHCAFLIKTGDLSLADLGADTSEMLSFLMDMVDEDEVIDWIHCLDVAISEDRMGLSKLGKERRDKLRFSKIAANLDDSVFSGLPQARIAPWKGVVSVSCINFISSAQDYFNLSLPRFVSELLSKHDFTRFGLPRLEGGILSKYDWRVLRGYGHDRPDHGSRA